ncbi:hypothetical protein [Agrococcus sp. ARC_14]|uniref:hypothetical protein n=1 Tax=Agrococcus sp. ARC_14 TaxID=2919927 RepID=UPI001F06178C|nr:hypothetical protein [Agrococcus sp. ARC_14]MCH1884084.1 hypothetical protein [Agrococcus sp. ARC_14]
MRTATIVAATMLTMVLAACSQTASAPTTAPSHAVAEPAPAVTPTAPAEPSPVPTTAPAASDPHAEWQELATPNGTASFLIPPGWTARMGGEELQYDGELHWQNSVGLVDERGTVQLTYWDGPGEDVGAGARFGIVASEPAATLDDAERASVDVFDEAYLEHAATAWWSGSQDQGFRAIVGLTTATCFGDSHPGLMVQDGERTISFLTLREMPSEAEAIAWLEGDEAALLMEIIGTLDLTAIPSPALPG